MKHTFILFFLFVNVISYGQKGEAMLYFNNGDIKIGYAVLKGASDINFKEEDSEKNKKYSFKDLEKVELKNAFGIKTYRLINTKKRNKIELLAMEEVIVGKVSLYQKVNEIKATPNPNGGFYNTKARYEKFYFLKRDGESLAVFCASSKTSLAKFNKKMTEYFKDCPNLKVENFSSKSMGSLVDSYNIYCD